MFAAACTNDGPPAEGESTAAAQVATAAAPSAVGPAVRNQPELGRLLTVMDGVGRDAEANYHSELQRFMARPQALGDLESHYASLPLESRAARWKAVYLLGKVPAAAALDTLGRIAVGGMKPAPSPAAEPEERFADQAIEREAAMALGLRAAKGEVPARPVVATVLERAHPEIAQAAALELFSAGALEDDQRKLLGARGISHNFRRHTAAEETELFTLSAADRAIVKASNSSKSTMIAPPHRRIEQ
jgi:hypothetical protein